MTLRPIPARIRYMARLCFEIAAITAIATALGLMAASFVEGGVDAARIQEIRH